MKKLWLLLALLVMALAIAACGGADDDEDAPDAPENGGVNGETVTPEPAPPPELDIVVPEGVEVDELEDLPGLVALEALNAALERFPEYINTGLPHVSGTTFQMGHVSPTPWTGIVGGGIFHTGAVDGEIASMLGTANSLMSVTDAYTFGQDGVVSWDYDLSANTFTMTMQRDVYWHDGVPLTLGDLVFTYYVMAHPDYAEAGGVRFSTYERMIVGIMDYHEGLADHIEGLVLSDDERTLTIHFEAMAPSKLFFGFWTNPMPRHIFENIPIADMPASDPVLRNPIGWGPFMLQSLVPGESYHLVRNPNYVLGEPLIEELIIERIASELVPEAMESGRFDYVTFPTAYYADHADPTNFQFIGGRNVEYSFLAFRLGHWNWDTNQNDFSPDRYMNNVYLRRAMAHAVDQNELGTYLFHGLQVQAGSFMPPHHTALMDLRLPGFPFDPALGNQILDEAGFVDIDNDGYREWPDGSDLTVNWAYATGNPEIDEVLIPFHQQGWRDIGVRVVLWQGRTHDIFYLWDMLDFDADDDEIHIYTAGWQSGFNPNPAGRWGGDELWSVSRYNSEEYTRLLNNLSDARAWDPEWRWQAYSELQWYLQDVVHYFPLRWSIDLIALNNRVTLWDTRVGQYPHGTPWHLIGLSAAEPYR